MASISRQDRALMRQRGAGSRKVENVDFGFSFPGSARSLRSTAKTPQSLRSSSRQPSQTPGTRGHGQSSIRSARHNSREPEHSGVDTAQPQGQQAERDGHHAKRRRLSSSIVTPKQLSLKTPTAATAGRRQSRRGISSQAFIIATDDDAGSSAEASQTPGTIAHSQIPSSPLFFPEHEPNKENNPAEDDSHLQELSLSLRRGVKDGHVGIVSPLNTSPSMNILALEHDVDDGRDADGKGSQENTEGLESGNRTRPKLDESSLHVLNTAGPSSQNKRKKRKSVVLGRKKKRSSGPRETEVAPADMPAQNSEVLGPSEAELISSSLPPGQRRTRSSFEVKAPGEGEGSPNSHRARSPKEIEEDDDGTYIQESSPEPQTPAATKRASKVPHYRTNPNRDTRAAGTKGSKPTFPILTHRLTNVSYLPTIHEASDDESRFENAMDIPNDRSQPNVVDVLSQICRETIENLVQDMSENVQPSERAALKNKRNALEEFGRDLNDELFELSEAVENRINLEARLRKSKRDKASLQTEWLELRKEREQIALRCDDVRRRHWEFEEQARERWDLSEAARRAELELERDDQPNEDGLEFLLRSVVSSVSSASEAGGLLDKVRSFNSQLERMAAVLEGRVRD